MRRLGLLLALGLCLAPTWGEAAVSCSSLTTGAGGAATSYATASISPSANALVLATISNGKTPPTVPTASGNSLTWVQVATVAFHTIATPTSGLTLFRALGTPTTGAVTFDFGGVSQVGAAWVVSQCTGVNVVGTNGSGAAPQSATNHVDGSTTLTVTLGSFASAANGAYSVFSFTGGASGTPDSGWTELSDSGNVETQWRADNDTTAAITVTSGDNAGIAIEVAVPGAASHSLLLGVLP